MHQTGIGGEKPNVQRKYLSPDEARRLIEAAGNVGRQCERNKLLLNLMYRHGLRVSEAIDLRWTDFDLDAPKGRPFWVRRLKGSKDTVHTLEPDSVRSLRKAKASPMAITCSGLNGVARCLLMPCNRSSHAPVGWLGSASGVIRICCVMLAASSWQKKPPTRD